MMKNITYRKLASAGLLTLGAASLAQAGLFERLYYDNIAGTPMVNFRNATDPNRTPTDPADQIYPSFPLGFTFAEIGDNGLGRIELAGDVFGTLTRVYIQAPLDGDYTFFIAADDSAELYISADHTPLNLRAEGNFWSETPTPIAFETGCCTLLFSGDRINERSSDPIALEKGKLYYLEAYQKEGGGGAFVEVGWQRPDGVQEIIPARSIFPYIFAESQNFPSASGITAGPVGADAIEGTTATFSVDIVAQPPLTIQWLENGTPIPGANLSYLTFPAVTLAQNGKTYTVSVNGQTSGGATLTVSPDTVPPSVVGARGSGFPQGIIVTFTEGVDEASATTIGNYVIAGQNLTISSATLLNSRQVLLEVSEYDITPLTVSVSNVKDLAQSPNTIAANTTVGVALTSNLLAYWDFNDDSNPDLAVDRAQGHPGEVLGGAAYSADAGGYSGQSGDKAMDLGTDANGQHVFVRDASFLNNASAVDQLTVSFWQKNYDTQNASSFWMISPTTGSGQRGAQGHVPWSNNNLYFDTAGCCTAGTQRINRVITDFPDYVEGFFTVWHHYAFVKNGSNKEIWIDGKLFHSGVNTLPLPSDFSTMFIGAGENAGNSAQAVIDDFSVFAKALSEADLGALKDGGNPQDFAEFLSAALTLVEGPTDVTVDELRTVTFNVSVQGGAPGTIGYQWFRDGVAIPGANQASYTTRVLGAADSGAKIKALAFNKDGSFNSIETDEVTLTVVTDVSGPAIVSAQSDFSLRKVHVQFDEGVEQASAETASNYAIEGLTVTGATLLPSGRGVTLDTSVQTAGASYTLTVNGVKDVSSAANPSVNEQDVFQAFSLVTGGVFFEAFTGIGTTPVSALTGDPKFPNSPDDTRLLTAFDTPNGYAENYGARVRGWFVPKVSGNYYLFLRSDDASALYFNPNGSEEVSFLTGATPVAEETGCCDAFHEPDGSPETTQVAYPLVAGQSYYMEALLKEAGGGDYLQVAYRLDTDTTPANQLRPIDGSELQTLRNLDGFDMGFTVHPQDQLAILPSPGDEITAFDLDGSDDGFTTGGPNPEMWVYNAAMGSWVADGGTGIKNATLMTPEVTVTAAGGVTVRLDHRYSFESGLWDGGQIRVSVNGGDFVTVPAENVVQNGYAVGLLIGNHDLKDQRGFNGDSAGYAQGVNITTTAILGLFNPGDKVRVQFYGAWDEGATGTIPNWVISSVGFFSLPEVAQEFAANDGGFFVETVGDVPFPWVYSAERGAWYADGSVSGCGGPYWSFLNSPAYLVVEDGDVVINFEHRYSFEGDLWDGGQVRISVNGADYVEVPASAFSANGYAEGLIVGNGILKDKNAFNADSPGYADGTYITSTANLGAFAAGDTISVQFLGGWDDCTTGSYPNWEVKGLSSGQLVLGDVPVASTFTAEAFATQNGAAQGFNYQWQRDDGNGWTDIPGATGAAYSIFPVEADLGAVFRAVAKTPGAQAESNTARLVLSLSEPVEITIGAAEGGVVVEFSGRLQSADTVNGTYSDVDGATSPYTIPAGTGTKFYRAVR